MSTSPNAASECARLIQDNGQQSRVLPCISNKSSPLIQFPGRSNYHPTTSQEPSFLPYRPLHSINAESTGEPTLSPRGRSVTDALSVASFGGVSSIMGNEASPRDIQELLDNLDKATSLIRRHVQEQEGTREKVPVSRPLIPLWITKYLLLLTFTWQILNVGLLEAVYWMHTDNITRHDLDLTSNVIMTVFQGVHLTLVFFVSFKLVKKVMHRSASGSLLAQCYLSTVLLFAGLYTLEYRFKVSSFNSVSSEVVKQPVMLFLRMLYFSVSTTTLCGTSAVEPVEWFASVTVSIQMLMSFVYFASILSLGVLPRKQSTRDRLQPEMSFTRKLKKIRRKLFGSPGT